VALGSSVGSKDSAASCSANTSVVGKMAGRGLAVALAVGTGEREISIIWNRAGQR
jgi:hypothetical protein